MLSMYSAKLVSLLMNGDFVVKTVKKIVRFDDLSQYNLTIDRVFLRNKIVDYVPLHRPCATNA